MNIYITRGDWKRLLLRLYFCWLNFVPNLLVFLLKFYVFLGLICNWVNILEPWPIFRNVVEKMRVFSLQVPRLAEGQIPTVDIVICSKQMPKSGKNSKKVQIVSFKSKKGNK